MYQVLTKTNNYSKEKDHLNNNSILFFLAFKAFVSYGSREDHENKQLVNYFFFSISARFIDMESIYRSNFLKVQSNAGKLKQNNQTWCSYWDEMSAPHLEAVNHCMRLLFSSINYVARVFCACLRNITLEACLVHWTGNYPELLIHHCKFQPMVNVSKPWRWHVNTFRLAYC